MNVENIRLITLLPEQIAKHWPIIRPAIESSLPPLGVEDPNRMANVLSSILGGRLEAHLVGTLREDGGVNIMLLVVTAFVEWYESQHRDLLIWSLYGNGDQGTVQPTLWKRGFELLERYARGKGCRRITAYSDVSSVIAFMKSVGAGVRAYLTYNVGGV